MAELILTYEEQHTGGEVINPSEKWSDHEDEIIEWTPLGVYVDQDGITARAKAPTHIVEQLEEDSQDYKVGDRVWIVVVRYITGGMFGRSLGNWDIQGVFKHPQEAGAMERQIEYEEKEYKEGRVKEDYSTYKPWRGYFERLENIEIHEFVIQ